ncbi:hypothetical protein HanIR_Chr13g0642301 [Helianthus annuus]|nr:hypothetical protein HanIR_Chr13g0642301 [Helianthus annuus]
MIELKFTNKPIFALPYSAQPPSSHSVWFYSNLFITIFILCSLPYSIPILKLMIISRPGKRVGSWVKTSLGQNGFGSKQVN